MDKRLIKRKTYDTKKYLYFDFENPNDVILYKLLEKAPRRYNKLLGIMAKEFMDNFGITEEISEKDLVKIIDMYDIIKNMKTNSVMHQVSSNYVTPHFPQENNTKWKAAEEASEKKEETIRNNNIEQEKSGESGFEELKNALSGFNFFNE